METVKGNSYNLKTQNKMGSQHCVIFLTNTLGRLELRIFYFKTNILGRLELRIFYLKTNILGRLELRIFFYLKTNSLRVSLLPFRKLIL